MFENILQSAGILTEKNLTLVTNHAKPDDAAYGLTVLQNAEILTEDNLTLVCNHAEPDRIASTLSTLQYAGILTEDNRTLIANHAEPDRIADALSTLQYAGILTEDNRTLVAYHAEPDRIADALSVLQYAGILTEDNRTLIANHTEPDSIAPALSILQNAGILNQDNFVLTVKHAHPFNLARFLYQLENARILNIISQDNFVLVAHLANPSSVFQALRWLHLNRILNQDNFTMVVTHVTPDRIANALSTLQNAEILTEDNRTLVANHAEPDSIAVALSALKNARILTEQNRSVVANHAEPDSIADALIYLQHAEILTEENFYLLVARNHRRLVSRETILNIWDQIPHITQTIFETLVAASEQPDPMAALIIARNQILGGRHRVEAHQIDINPEQSTHTASVHRSVSESALRLMKRYGDDLNLETTIEEIEAYVMSLDHSFKHQAAKRCIARISKVDYTFTDPSSVSTRQLLALTYTAIHDETKRLGSQENAQDMFVESLYEIQRGYNLNDQNIDNLSPEDAFICSAGTFNKLIEKLNGIHSDVVILFITHQGLYIKFPKVVAEHALTYLNRFAHPETVHDYLSIKALLNRIKEDGLGPIWDEIKSAVESALWDEFKEAYADNREHPKFRTTINHGQYSNAPNLVELHCQLEASPGYQTFLYQLEQKSLEKQKIFSRLHQHSLWTNRSSSPEAQNAFDRQYGLIVQH